MLRLIGNDIYCNPFLKLQERTKTEKKSRMEDEKLIIDGKTYTVDNLDQLPASLNVVNLTSKSNEEYFAFFRELNPLSNFHPANFVLHGHNFTSTEQYIQYRKASYFDDFVTANKITNTSALKCKELARQIKDFNKSQWETVAKNQCKPDIECKFIQNPSLMDLLLNLTEDKIIVESTGDRFGVQVSHYTEMTA